MAGIFNLFGDISRSDKGQVMKPLSRSKTSLGIQGTSAKALGQPKPKGLSIRSHSDLNVATTQRVGLNQDIANKPQEYLKPKLTQLDIGGLAISPNKKLIEKPNKLKDLSPKKLLSEKKNIKSQKPILSEEKIFKSPLPPKKFIKESYPEPEKLAPYYDIQFEFDDIYTKTIANEFREYLMNREEEVVVYEDEGFVSDTEPIEFDVPNLCSSPLPIDEDWQMDCTLDLPVISDDDDGF